MKKFILLISFLSSFLVYADHYPNKDTIHVKNAIVLEPLAFLGSGLQLGYEHFFSEKQSGKVNLGYYSNSGNFYYDAEAMTGFNTTLSYKRFISPMVEDEFRVYFGLMAIFKSIQLTNYEDENSFTLNTEKKNVDASAAGGGVLVGSTITFENGFFVDSNIGGAILSGIGNEENIDIVNVDVINPYKNGVIPRLNLSIGLVF